MRYSRRRPWQTTCCKQQYLRRARIAIREDLSLSINGALEGNADESIRHATLANYTLCVEGRNLLWSPAAGSGGASLAIRTHPESKDLIIQTPHSFYDLGTLEEGLFLFQQSNARALLSSGTHRCASEVSSPCSGETKVCTLFSSEPFRISDMAHTDTSLFHSAHIALAEGFPNTTILQLHMFLDPGASVSNGKKKRYNSRPTISTARRGTDRGIPQ